MNPWKIFFGVIWTFCCFLGLVGTLNSGISSAQMLWALAGLLLLWSAVLAAVFGVDWESGW